MKLRIWLAVYSERADFDCLPGIWKPLFSLEKLCVFFFQCFSTNPHRDVYPRLHDSRLFGSFCCLNFGGLTSLSGWRWWCRLSCCCPCCLELSFKNCHNILFGWLPLCVCFFLRLFLRPSLFRISKVSKQHTWETFQHEGCLEKLIVALSKRVEESVSI